MPPPPPQQQQQQQAGQANGGHRSEGAAKLDLDIEDEKEMAAAMKLLAEKCVAWCWLRERVNGGIRVLMSIVVSCLMCRRGGGDVASAC
jgi:hypothetical protein